MVDAQFFEAPSGRGVDSRQHLWSGFFSRFVVYCIGIAVCLLQQALRLRKSVHFRFHCFKSRAGIERQAWNRSRLRGPRAWFGLWNFCRVWIRFRTFLLLIFKRGTFCGRRFTVVHELTAVPPLLRLLFRRITSLLSTVSWSSHT